jgi:hypothetical protein
MWSSKSQISVVGKALFNLNDHCTTFSLLDKKDIHLILKHCPIYLLKVNTEVLQNSSRFHFLPETITCYCTRYDDPSTNINKSPLVWGESFMPLPFVTMFSRMMPILHLPPTSSQFSHFCKHNILFIYSMLTVYDTWEVTFKRLSWSVILLIAHWGCKRRAKYILSPKH